MPMGGGVQQASVKLLPLVLYKPNYLGRETSEVQCASVEKTTQGQNTSRSRPSFPVEWQSDRRMKLGLEVASRLDASDHVHLE